MEHPRSYHVFSRVLTPDKLEGRLIEKSWTIFILLKYHRLSPYLDLDK